MSTLDIDVISDPNQVMPAWLSEILRAAGVLVRGCVETMRHELVLEYNSSIYRLHLGYSSDAAPDAPATLILKLKQGDGARDEFEIGRKFDPHRAKLPMLLGWHDAAYSKLEDRGYFLMRDLSATHVQSVSVIDATGGRPVPSQAQLDQIIDTIAHFHAYWWQHAELAHVARVPNAYLSAENFAAQIVAPRFQQLADFVRAEGKSVPAEMLRLLEREVEQLAALYERFIQPRLDSVRDVTLVHGDCYFGQFQCPKNPARHRVYMIDLESAHTFLPGLDLYYLFATFWTGAQRREGGREMRCLRRYHAQLQSRGVTHFTFENVVHDYRVAIALMVLHPVWDKVVGGSRRQYWWPKMKCLCEAYLDWNCDQLIA